MSIIYAKIKMSDNILQACKIIRKHSTLPIDEIKTRIEKNEALLESDYLDLDQLIVMQEILASLIGFRCKKLTCTKDKLKWIWDF